MLKSSIYQGLKHVLKLMFVKEKRRFILKSALFAEKSKNKFAYEFKWNKFVLNIDL